MPLFGGLLLGAGALLGLGGDGHGHGHVHADTTSAHHDVGHDGHGESASFLTQAAALLGLGRVPLGISLMMILLIFGGTGTALNLAFAEPLSRSAGWVGVSLGGSLLATLMLTGSASRLLARVAPPLETYPVKKSDLVGCTAVLINDTDENGGYAQVRDREGNVHNITCQICSGAGAASLPKGTLVLVVDFEPASNRYSVEQCPPELEGPGTLSRN